MVRSDEPGDFRRALLDDHREVTPAALREAKNEGVYVPMRLQTYAVCLLAALGAAAIGLGIASTATAERTRFWRQTDYAEFQRGTAKGVAIRSDGWLTPAPHFAAFADPNLAYLWTVRADSHGHIYAAGGSNAKVVRLDEKGGATAVFDSPELSAQAIVFDKGDNLYVATSPDGKVYKVTAGGQKSVFFDPKTKYIWALAIDSGGTLFIATGDSGEVFAVNPDGKGDVFYKSAERHARSLAFDTQGNLLIGTDPSGLILRVDVSRAKSGAVTAGRAFVLNETDKKEVTALLADYDGDIYAAAIGEKPRPAFTPGAPAGVPAPAPAPSANPGGAPAAPSPVPAAVPFFPPLSGGGTVVHIAPDGSPDTLWSSREDAVYSLGFSSAGKLLIGTGSHGNIIEYEGNGVFSTIANAASDQVTSIMSGSAGTVYAATANPGKIFVLGPGYEKDGSYESEAFDARIFSQWGRLAWWGENGATSGKVAFYVRSGNTSHPEETWSAWTGPYSSADGDAVKCPPARFVQWKAVFLQTGSDPPPDISWVNLAYLPKNVAPVIDGIAIQDPGIRLQGIAAAPAGSAPPLPVQVRMPSSAIPGNPPANAGATDFSGGRPPRIDSPPQGFEQKGYRSVVWTAHDDNDDDIVYMLYIRAEGEKNWRLLKDKIEQKHYTWDATTMPDGAYYLKLVASDSPSNPSDRALSAERISERFEIDNAPPSVAQLRAEPAKSGDATVSFSADDAASTIRRAEYSLDSGDWIVVYPKGQLSDSPHESYEITLRDLAAGEHTLSVRVANRFENSASAKVTFQISR
jgi:hypothetical protein